EICEGSVEFNSLNEDEQLEILEITNACYRLQMPIIEDNIYDGF
ncbi:MAG: DNA ligase (NAD+), partial [Cocleimonas sp.]